MADYLLKEIPMRSKSKFVSSPALRTRLMRSGAALALLVAVTAAGEALAAAAPQEVDLLISGGTVYDGGLTAGVKADVGITGDKVVFVGPSAGVKAKRTIDASGLIVTPGFIDGHVHTNGDIFSKFANDRLVASNLYQGVTTNILGVDGGGSPDVRDQFVAASNTPPGVNFATFVGFGAIRQKVLKQDAREPSASELEEMKSLVVKGMCEGALGLSTGLFYSPQSYAKTEEVIELAKEASKRGGIYDSHQRDEGGAGTVGIENSVRELLRISKEANIPGHFAHLKNSGVSSWGKSPQIIGMIELARSQGQKIAADQYPFLASSGSVASILMPRWMLAGGRNDTLKRLDDPTFSGRIRGEMFELLNNRGGGKNLLVIRQSSPWLGKTLEDIAKTWHMNEVDAAIRVYKEGDEGMAIFAISEDDVRKYMVKPWVMTGSDGSDGHPRKYATFALIYDKYVVKEKILSLAQFVHRSSGLPAETYQLEQRGYLKPGYFADVAVFDPKGFVPKATYTEPKVLAEGMIHVVVNGKVELEKGKLTEVAAGRPLAHKPTAGTCS